MSRPVTSSDHGWRNNAVHREVDSRNARWVFKIVVGVAIAVPPLAIYLVQTMTYVQTSYAIEDARRHATQLVEWERRLTVEKDVLESLPEVERQAGVRLGLEHAPASHIIVVSPGELDRPAPSGPPSHRPPSR
jgi:hypothetical protein